MGLIDSVVDLAKAVAHSIYINSKESGDEYEFQD